MQVDEAIRINILFHYLKSCLSASDCKVEYGRIYQLGGHAMTSPDPGSDAKTMGREFGVCTPSKCPSHRRQSRYMWRRSNQFPAPPTDRYARRVLLAERA
jgi:hypothetical protein